MLSQLEVLPDSEPTRKNGSSARRKRGRPSKNRSLLAAQLTAASDVIDAEGPYDVIKVQIEDVEEEHGSMPKRQREHSISTSSPVANVSPVVGKTAFSTRPKKPNRLIDSPKIVLLLYGLT